MNYYELLEISPSASVEVIRNAYKTLAKKYHPDTYRGDVSFAEEKMKLLNEAVSVLENEDKRKEYNKLNGITPSGQSGYGRNNMLNVDENGEPIFFTYDEFDENEEPDGPEEPESFGKSYMDIIDDFIKNSRLERKSKRKAAKKKEPECDVDDIPKMDIDADQPANDKNDKKDKMAFEYDNPFADDISESKFGAESEFDSDQEAEFRTFNFPGRSKSRAKNKNLSKKTNIYYMVVAFLIAMIIFFGILIMQSLNLENISELMKGFSGRPEQNEIYVFEDNTTAHENPEEFIPPVENVDGQDIPVAANDENDIIKIEEEAIANTAESNNAIKETVKTPEPLPAETRRPIAPQPPPQPQTVRTEPAQTTEPFIESATIGEEKPTEPVIESETTEEPTIITEEITDGAEPDTSEAETEAPPVEETEEPTVPAPVDPEDSMPDEER